MNAVSTRAKNNKLNFRCIRSKAVWERKIINGKQNTTRLQEVSADKK